jgi:hypothetical protein
MTDTPPAPASTTTTTADPGQVTTISSVKAGWKTTEFWFTLAAKVAGVLTTAGVLGDGSTAQRCAGLAVIVLAQFGYTWSRTTLKAAA